MLLTPAARPSTASQNDPKHTSVCYGDCAQAWPAVLIDGAPVAGSGIRRPLLVTNRRRDGKRKITCAGQSLHYHAHERRGATAAEIEKTAVIGLMPESSRRGAART